MRNQIPDEKISGLRTGEGEPSRIVIDGAYFRRQARDAMRAFIAPLNGVYAAATGTQPAKVVDETPKSDMKAL